MSVRLVNMVLLFSGLILMTPANGQEFAPLGAEWYYDQWFAFSSDISYSKISSVGDTAIGGKHCRILLKEGNPCCGGRPDTEYMYEENGALYFWDNDFNRFQVLYDFNKKVNESWRIGVKHFGLSSGTDTIKYIVDSLSTITINRRNLRVMHATCEVVSNWCHRKMNVRIIEKIGDVINYMFCYYNPAQGMYCDGNYAGGLRCYSDSELGYFSTGLAPSCTYANRMTAIEDRETNPKIKVFPNPSMGIITLESGYPDEVRADLVDLTGKVLVTKVLRSNTRLDLSAFSPGLYLLIIQKGDQRSEVLKIIRQ